MQLPCLRCSSHYTVYLEIRMAKTQNGPQNFVPSLECQCFKCLIQAERNHYNFFIYLVLIQLLYTFSRYWPSINFPPICECDLCMLRFILGRLKLYHGSSIARISHLTTSKPVLGFCFSKNKPISLKTLTRN